MNIKKINLETIDNVKKISPSLYKESINLSIPFFMLHKVLFEKGEVILKDYFSMTQTELDVLVSLLYSSKQNSLSPTELYDIMIFSSGGMTKVLKKLETKKFIKRIENNEDKRSKLVQITKEGKDIAIKALSQILEFEETYFSKLDKNEQELFQKLLYKMLV